jgi:AcrR family transcriptional regulator
MQGLTLSWECVINGPLGVEQCSNAFVSYSPGYRRVALSTGNECEGSRAVLSEQDTVKAIEDAAISVFFTEDFHRATIREIASRANVAVGTIYTKFRSKEQLLYSIIESNANQWTDELNEQLAGVAGTSMKLRKVTHHFFIWNEQNYQLAWLTYISVPLKGWLESLGYQAAKGQGQLIQTIIKEGQALGEVRSDVDARLVTLFYLGAAARVVTHWLATDRSHSLVDVVDDLTSFVLRGIGTADKEHVQPGREE